MLSFKALLGAAGAVGKYNPLVSQPFITDCVLWLGMDDFNRYINRINGTLLTNYNVSTTNPTYDYTENPLVPVFNNTNRVGAFIRSGIFLNGSVDFAITFYVKNPIIESQYNSEVVFSNTNKTDGVGFIAATYEKDTGTFEVGSTTYGSTVFNSTELGNIYDWLKVLITYNSLTCVMTVVINNVIKTKTLGIYGTNYEIGIFDTTVNTGGYAMSLNGSIADFRVYNKQLQQFEIALYMD